MRLRWLLALLCVPTMAHAYVHPGLLNNAEELAFIREKVTGGVNPWAKVYAGMPNQVQYTPAPVVFFNQTFDAHHGGGQLFGDCKAAYNNALRWVVTQEPAPALTAAKILDAWSHTLKGIGSHPQNRLETGWSWGSCLYAAEILRHTGAPWSSAGQASFATLLGWVVNHVQDTDLSGEGSVSRNNWAAFGARTRIAVGIYLDQSGLVSQGLADAEKLIRFYIGRFGHKVPNGFTYETCRDGNGAMGSLQGGDLQHMQYGIGALVEAAEMAKHQGYDLYGVSDHDGGLRDALIYHAPFVKGQAGNWPCQTPLGSINHSPQWMPWTMPATAYQDATMRSVADSLGSENGTVTGAPWSALTHQTSLGNPSSPTDGGGDGPLPPPWNLRLVVK